MNKDSVKTFLMSGPIFGILMGLFYGLTGGIYKGIVLGIVSGFFFGLAICAFVEFQSRKFKKIGKELAKGKKIIKDGGANHFKGAESVGGWMYLTTEEIIFKSHALNIQTHEAVIPLEQIAELKASSNMGIPNGLQIVTNNGTIEKFIVFNRNTWVKEIKNAKSSLSN